MKRRSFLNLAGTTVVIAGVTYYLLSDKNNLIRADIKQDFQLNFLLRQMKERY